MTFIRDWFLFKLPNFDLIRLNAFEHHDDKSRHRQKFNDIHLSKQGTQVMHIVVYSCDLIMCCLSCASLHVAILKYGNFSFVLWIFPFKATVLLRWCYGSCNIHAYKLWRQHISTIFFKYKAKPRYFDIYFLKINYNSTVYKYNFN